MKNYIILFLVGIPLLTYSQVNTFQQNYDVDNGTSDSGYYMTSEGTGLVLGSGTLCKFGNIELGCDGLLKVDSHGNLLWQKIYHAFPYSFDGRKIKHVFGDGYLFCGSAFSSTGFHPFLMRLDENGDSLWLRFYVDSLMRKAGDFEIKGDGKILVYGAGSIAPNYQHAFVMQTDANGEKEWVTTIDVNSPQYRGGDFHLLGNKDMVFGYKRSPLENFEHTLALTRTDSLGNVLWTKEYQTNEDDYCNAYMTPLHNGGFVLGYCIDTSSSSIQYGKPPKLFATDSLGNLTWTHTFTGAKRRTITRLITASNGDIIGSGYRSLEDGLYGWLFRLTQEGELLWKRAYQPEQPIPIDIISELNDVVETPDGGIAAIGTMMDSFPDGGISPDVWLLKVDGDGCFTPGCTDSIVTATVERRDGVLHSGRQVYFRLSPNPVSGEAQVVFYQPVPQGARLRVFNAQGVPVAEREVPPGSTEAQVDFSGLPPGLYLVQYLRQGRVLQVERVVRGF